MDSTSARCALGGAVVAVSGMVIVVHYDKWFPPSEASVKRRILRKYKHSERQPTAGEIQSEVDCELEIPYETVPFANVLYVTAGIVGAVCGVVLRSVFRK
jgi:hypothetical protein